MRVRSARLMLEWAIQRGLQEITGGDCRRAVRSMVEDACHLIRSGYPKQLFAGMKDMFRTEAHPYFELASRAAHTLDRRFFTGFGVNLCYESWIVGAYTLREHRSPGGEKLPWLTSFDMDGQTLTSIMTKIDADLPQGVNTYLLRAACLNTEALRALSRCYPKCAFAVLTPDEAVTAAAVAALDEAANVLLIPCRRDGEFTSAPLLKQHRRLYALCRPLDEAALLRVMASGDLTPPGDAECLLPMFEPDLDIAEPLRLMFNEWIEQRRQHPTQPVFPVDLTADIMRVQKMIAHTT